MQRRHFLQTAVAGSFLWTNPGLFAEQLFQTPRLTEGPFYPDKLPLDTDNDLLILNDSLTPAVGEVTYLTGRVLDSKGEPLRNAFVEKGSATMAEPTFTVAPAMQMPATSTSRDMAVFSRDQVGNTASGRSNRFPTPAGLRTFIWRSVGMDTGC